VTAAACFSQAYAEARPKFLQAARDAGLAVTSHEHPRRGRDGEVLAMDVARLGVPDASSVLVLTSACHGVEGFCGSGVQVSLLGDAGFRAAAQRSGVAVLFIHALNPYGFSWWRRTTHENVDLNRNFHDFSKPLPPSPAYDEIASWIVPEQWPPTPEVHAAALRYIAQHGEKGFQAAISSGQHKYPDGLFYGGREPTWSNRTLQRARAWWGDGVTSIYDGSSTSALLTGLMWLAAYEECPQAEYTGIALEYGTLPVLDVMNALRADQWLENHPDTGAPMRQAIKRQLRDAFYTDTDVWKEMIVAQAREASLQAISGLAR
jgi:hypothetical protein